MKRLTFAVLMACSSVSFAQQPSGDAIPKDLVKLLVRGTTTAGDLDVVLGLPADFPPELLPPAASPLIGTVSRNSTMVIAEAPDLPAESPRFERQLAAAGWTKPQGWMAGHGLVSSPPPPMPSIWCHGDRYATVTLLPRPQGGSFARLSVNTATPVSRGGPCSPSPRPGYASIFSEVDIPTLLPPPESRAIGGGGANMGPDNYDQRLRLQTPLPLPAVLQHYRAQIEKHGWTYQSQAIADGIGVARFSLTSPKKEPIVAILSVTQIPGDQPLEISFHLVKASSGRYLP